MVYAKIKRLCFDRNLTFAELERATGISNGTIAKWEHARPRIDMAKKVADYFGVKLDDLIEDDEQDGT